MCCSRSSRTLSLCPSTVWSFCTCDISMSMGMRMIYKTREWIRWLGVVCVLATNLRYSKWINRSSSHVQRYYLFFSLSFESFIFKFQLFEFFARQLNVFIYAAHNMCKNNINNTSLESPCLSAPRQDSIYTLHAFVYISTQHPTTTQTISQ